MIKKRWGRVGGIAAVGAAMIVVLKACTPLTMAPRPILDGVVGVSQFQREAQEGGLVTVDAGVLPGPLPDLNMTGPPTTLAWFSNEGADGKHEKRYGWKPRSDAEYELVLSNDGSGRTKWTMNEINRATRARASIHSGHLWACEDYHAPAAREVGFRDCPRTVPYDSAGLRSSRASEQVVSFASYLKGSETRSEEALSPQNAPIWISCTSGCCTMGR